MSSVSARFLVLIVVFNNCYQQIPGVALGCAGAAAIAADTASGPAAAAAGATEMHRLIDQLACSYDRTQRALPRRFRRSATAKNPRCYARGFYTLTPVVRHVRFVCSARCVIPNLQCTRQKKTCTRYHISNVNTLTPCRTN